MHGARHCALAISAETGSQPLSAPQHFRRDRVCGIDVDGPQPTLAHLAVKVRSEPNAEVLNSCCERTQRENLLRRREVAAASQKEIRPFRQYAVNLKP